MFTIKKIGNVYQGSTKFWNDETLQHEAIYTISKTEKGYTIFKKEVELESHTKLVDAKESLLKIAYEPIELGEIEEGFRDGGGYSGGVCICGDGNGFAWHKENGVIIRD